MVKLGQIRELLKRRGGVIKLRPEFVQRFYPDFNRMGQSKMRKSKRQFIPERWIGSSVRAVNPRGIPTGGLSMIQDSPEPISLADAIRAAPMEMIGQDLLDAHGPEFRVLTKILDPGEPIPFHLHATDAEVARSPRRFPGHHFGKDEAYYFLGAPKGPQPYTHVGLYPGVRRSQLIAAVRKGPEHALEMSPCIYQHCGEGFFLPAGVPHRPGTALTLEVQQPSDVYSLFRKEADFDLIDFELSHRVAEFEGFRLTPILTPGQHRGGEIATIFPTEICRKFQGRRLRASQKLVYSESLPFVILIWKGSGRLAGRPVRAGDEFFVAHDVAAHGVELRSTGATSLEAFTFLPGV
jgi:mannose-6-phosphate isomerase class I